MTTSAVKSGEEAYQRPLAFYRAGNYARCRDAVGQALAADPQNASWLVLQGMAHSELGESDEAVATLERATRLAPQDPDAWRQLGLALLTAGERKGAAEAFQTSLRLRPGDVPGLVDLANLLFMLAHVQEAIDTLEQAHPALPGSLAVLRNLADMYQSASRPEDALRVAQEILELQPEDVVATCDAAWLHLQLGRPAQAADLFRALRRIDPEHELYAVHGLVLTEVHARNWRRALDLAIEATLLDRFELTTQLLVYISNKLFGKTRESLSAKELTARFEDEHRDHRRLHAEAPAAGKG